MLGKKLTGSKKIHAQYIDSAGVVHEDWYPLDEIVDYVDKSSEAIEDLKKWLGIEDKDPDRSTLSVEDRLPQIGNPQPEQTYPEMIVYGDDEETVLLKLRSTVAGTKDNGKRIIGTIQMEHEILKTDTTSSGIKLIAKRGVRATPGEGSLDKIVILNTPPEPGVNVIEYINGSTAETPQTGHVIVYYSAGFLTCGDFVEHLNIALAEPETGLSTVLEGYELTEDYNAAAAFDIKIESDGVYFDGSRYQVIVDDDGTVVFVLAYLSETDTFHAGSFLYTMESTGWDTDIVEFDLEMVQASDAVGSARLFDEVLEGGLDITAAPKGAMRIGTDKLWVAIDTCTKDTSNWRSVEYDSIPGGAEE